MLATPRSKESLDFLSNFNFTTIKIEKLWRNMGTFDLSKCFYFVTVFSTLLVVSFGVNWSVVALLHLVKVLIVLIPWVKAWYLHELSFATEHHRLKSSQNKLVGQHNHTMSFFTNFDSESVISSNKYNQLANIYYGPEVIARRSWSYQVGTHCALLSHLSS